jgi:antitoxin Phd
MGTITVSEARKNLPALLKIAQTEPVTVGRRGQAEAVIVSAERYNELMAAWEDAEDVAASDAALAEEGPSIPWEQLKRDLGWTE